MPIEIPAGAKPAKLSTKTQKVAVATQYGDYVATADVDPAGTATVTVRTGTYKNKNNEDTDYRIGSVLIDGQTINVAGLPEDAVTGDTIYGQTRIYKVKDLSKNKKDKNGVQIPAEVVRFEVI
jgi:hypothetical protein